MKKPPPEYLTIAEIADALGCSDSHDYNTLIHQIPGAWKLGTRWRLTREDLDAYIEEQRATHAAKQVERQRRSNEPASVKPRSARVPKAVPGTTEQTACTIRPSRARHPSPLAEELRLSSLHVQQARHFSPLRDQLRASLNGKPADTLRKHRLP